MSLSREIRGLFFLCIRIDSPIGGRGGSIRPTTPAPYPQKFFLLFFLTLNQSSLMVGLPVPMYRITLDW